jgi:Holliday junction resolvasome RuvABC endonuclease subunit
VSAPSVLGLDLSLTGTGWAASQTTGTFKTKLRGGERIGELGGVIRVALHERGVPFVEVSPAGRARYATGLGNASKDRVVGAIAARTGIAFETSDECDAWILRAMALDHYGDSVVEMPAKHREALRAIDWPELAG